MKSIRLDKSLKYILPLKTDDLVRFGNKNDSGYVVSRKILKEVNFMISFGMSNNWSFEENFLRINSNNKVQIYDHTVDYNYFFFGLLKAIKRIFYFKSSFQNILKKLNELIGYHKIINNKRIHHFRIKVSNKNSIGEKNLKQILEKVRNKKILLSIDIEGDEYKILNNISKHSKFIHLIVIEFHHIDKKRSSFKKIIKELKKKFNIIHIHGNNYTSFCKDGLPITLEMTLINKKLYSLHGKRLIKKFPNKKLDYPNFKNQPDLQFYY